MNNFGPPGGFRRELNSAQIARTTARSLTASQSKRGPYILRILVMVAWHYPKELDGRAASLTRKQIRAMLKAIEMGMSKESVRKVLETLALAKLVVLEGSKVRASAELLTDLATLESGSGANASASAGQSAGQENASAKPATSDQTIKRSAMELEDLETLIQALDESLRTGIRQVSIDVMAASKEPMRLFLDAVATVASRAAKGESFEDLTAEIRKAMTAAPSNRVSSATFAVVYRLKRVRELAEQKERDRVEIDMLWMRAQLEQDQKVAAATSTASAPEPGTGPEIQPAAVCAPDGGKPDGKVHQMFIAPNSAPNA